MSPMILMLESTPPVPECQVEAASTAGERQIGGRVGATSGGDLGAQCQEPVVVGVYSMDVHRPIARDGQPLTPRGESRQKFIEGVCGKG